MEDSIMNLLYGHIAGRWLLKLLLKLGFPKLLARYLNSRRSRKLVPKYIKKHDIPMNEYEKRDYGSFGDFFGRRKTELAFDGDPAHFTSPCDGWLSAYRICNDSCFQIKDSYYRVSDLVNCEEVSDKYNDGVCLIIRLAATDCHHYSFCDDGYISDNNYIEGKLHSVQPISCEKYPVYRLNRRCWSLLDTKNFGEIVQVEVGALAVGGIVNMKENAAFAKGEDMGHFTLCGSTIVLFVQKNRLKLLPEIENIVNCGTEYRVKQGMWIATKED